MQKLLVKLKNTPVNTSLVYCSVNSGLNKVGKLSVQSKVLANNNLEGNQPQRKEGKNLRVSSKVYVLNQRGKSLMSTTPRKAKILLKQGKVKVVKRAPFTIQLLYSTGENKQLITLGIDSGAKYIGFSAISNKAELISGTVILDNMMKKRLDDKRMYRRQKRNKLWYRKPRFMNRTRFKGWLPPSIKRGYQTHLTLINKIKNILPIKKIIVEVGKFDIQKIENPDIEGKEYQQGSMYGYRNRIAYLIAREKGICQYCNKKYGKGNGWRLHHIWGKSKDRPQDWALIHEKCHEELHKKKLEYLLQKKKFKSYKESTFMNIVRKRFKKDINCEITYGNITFQDRCNLGLEKSHNNDAFIIANGNSQERCISNSVIQKRQNNRKLQINRKGFKPSIRKQRYKIQPKDLVKIENKIFRVKGIFSYGKQIQLINKMDNIINKSVKKLDEWIFHSKTLIWG